jgi:hypothetical protein
VKVGNFMHRSQALLEPSLSLHRRRVPTMRGFILPTSRPSASRRQFFPIFLQYSSPQSVAHFCILPLTAHAKVLQGALLRETEGTQASVDEPRGRASERGEGYMFRAELRKKMGQPEQRGTGCSDRQRTFQTVAGRLGDLSEPNVPRGTLGSAKLGDLGEPNVPRGTLGSAKSGGRDNRPSPIGDLTVR